MLICANNFFATRISNLKWITYKQRNTIHEGWPLPLLLNIMNHLNKQV
jgi:hypothetical protein